jgi:hypothetical protein
VYEESNHPSYIQKMKSIGRRETVELYYAPTCFRNMFPEREKKNLERAKENVGKRRRIE